MPLFLSPQPLAFFAENNLSGIRMGRCALLLSKGNRYENYSRPPLPFDLGPVLRVHGQPCFRRPGRDST